MVRSPAPDGASGAKCVLTARTATIAHSARHRAEGPWTAAAGRVVAHGANAVNGLPRALARARVRPAWRLSVSVPAPAATSRGAADSTRGSCVTRAPTPAATAGTADPTAR